MNTYKVELDNVVDSTRKVAKQIGTSVGILVPRAWLGETVIALRLSELPEDIAEKLNEQES